MSMAKVTMQVSPEIERRAVQRAQDRVKAARWDLDVAVFFFAVLVIVIILLFQGIGIEVIAPAAIFGLAMGWLMGWKKGRQVYARFYNEELSRLEKEIEETMSALEDMIEERVQKATHAERND
jgi:hypothetical protein